jgi:hypothetical protein
LREILHDKILSFILLFDFENIGTQYRENMEKKIPQKSHLIQENYLQEISQDFVRMERIKNIAQDLGNM